MLKYKHDKGADDYMKKKYNTGEFVKGSVAKVPFTGEVIKQYGDFVDVDIYIKDKKSSIIKRVRDTFKYDLLSPLF